MHTIAYICTIARHTVLATVRPAASCALQRKAMMHASHYRPNQHTIKPAQLRCAVVGAQVPVLGLEKRAGRTMSNTCGHFYDCTSSPEGRTVEHAVNGETHKKASLK